jgi:hypothetical protein
MYLEVGKNVIEKLPEMRALSRETMRKIVNLSRPDWTYYLLVLHLQFISRRSFNNSRLYGVD